MVVGERIGCGNGARSRRSLLRRSRPTRSPNVLGSSALLCAVLALLVPGSTRAELPTPPPNLLLLVAEDLGPRIGAFGDPVARTPHLDRLAAEGVRFTNVYATAGVCAPSRAALITGVHQIAMGGQHMRAESRPAGGYRAVPPPDVKAFPERLRAAGYYTFVTEKLDYQFSGHALGSGPFTIWDAEGDPALWAGRAPGQPFFGMLNFMQTHESGLFRPIGSWPHSWMHLGLQLYRWWRFGLPGGDGPTPPGSVVVPPYYPDRPEIREDIARHYDNIAQMDAAVGGILSRLEADGLADSTLVVWTTDHGDGLPRAKRELLDAGIHVPMIVRWPDALRPTRFAPGSADGRLISLVDVAPTLLARAGAPPDPSMHGHDFLDPDREPREFVFAARDRIDEVVDRQRAVRDTRFAYIRSWYPELPGGHPLAFRDVLETTRTLRRLHEDGRLDAAERSWFEAPGPERLFDTRKDPHQLHDLSDDPEQAAVLRRMRGALDAWLERTEDWSRRSEAEMVAGFRPGGSEPVTPPPTLRIERGRLVAEVPITGASIGYRIDGGRWQLYTGPIEVSADARVEARAVRYGWAESETASLRITSEVVAPLGRLGGRSSSSPDRRRRIRRESRRVRPDAASCRRAS